MELFRSNWKHTEYQYWISFYPKFCQFHLTFEGWGYFDSRPVIQTQLTTILSLVLFLTGFFWLGLLFLIVPWGEIFIKLPYDTKKYDECENPSWGIYWYGHDGFDSQSIWIRLGKKSKVIYMPWNLEWYRTSVLLKDGTWETEKRGSRKEFYDKDVWGDKIHYETHSYTYKLKSGKVQNVTAECYVKEMEWRRKAWMKYPFKNLVRRTIEINFSDEVGERAGEWKGGCVGCSYKIRKGETIEQCLRRMEKERKFN